MGARGAACAVVPQVDLDLVGFGLVGEEGNVCLFSLGLVALGEKKLILVRLVST
jgi:hypothetical protein